MMDGEAGIASDHHDALAHALIVARDRHRREGEVGVAEHLADGILRMRYRASRMRPAFLTPDQVYEVMIDLWATSHVFLPGHRVRLEISSSNFPRFDRNLNTGEDQATGSRRQTAAQTILHDQRYPSHILLPVIPR